jgi:hypothetical protein
MSEKKAFQIKDRRKQLGARRAMVDLFLNKWFEGYDWVIRLNPDVLIRNDTWLVNTLLRPDIDAILLRYGPKKFHSDFCAFRPQAVIDGWQKNLQRKLEQNGASVADEFMNKFRSLRRSSLTAEEQMDIIFRPLVDASRVAGIPHARRRGPFARLMGSKSPVLHVHEILRFCPNYLNASDGVWF